VTRPSRALAAVLLALLAAQFLLGMITNLYAPIHPATASRTGAGRTGLLRSGGNGEPIAWRTVRRCTSYLRASARTPSPSR